MKRTTSTLLTVLLAGLFAISCSTPAEAQFLNKLGKALNKVNKGLDKVNKTLNQNNNKKKGETRLPDKSDAGSSSDNNRAAPNTAVFDESGMKDAKVAFNEPYLTADTKFLEADPFYISDVSDGVFAVKRGMAYEFWKIDGKKLFDADWLYCGWDIYLWRTYQKAPLFIGGVTAAKRASGKGNICLLYVDGRVKECDPSWKKVSLFIDGIAYVEAEVNYKKQHFYINSSGQKIYPNLPVGDEYSPIRPLRDGLRAYPDKNNDWGFIDANGNVKITAKYREVRDFSEGYAWVCISDGIGQPQHVKLIDKTGKVVFDPQTDQLSEVGDVCDGRFYVGKGSDVIYYDTNGAQLAQFGAGNDFYDDRAFVVKGEMLDSQTVLVDRNFNALDIISDEVLPSSCVEEGTPVFEPYGIASVNTGWYVIDPEGRVVLHQYDPFEGNTYIRGFQQFSPDGYARCTEVQIQGKRCEALMKPSGEIVWLFSEEAEAAGPYEEKAAPPVKLITTPYPGEPGGGGYEIILPQPAPPGFRTKVKPIDDKPIGPTIVTPVKYKVSVVASPAEGGTVTLTPSGTFGIGDYATVTASPNENWAVTYVSTSAEGQRDPELGKPFAVLADQTVTVKFAKKEIEEKPDRSGTYEGVFKFNVVSGDELKYDIPLYCSISLDPAEDTPYGSDNYGYMAIMFDPDKRYVSGDRESVASFFAAPLKICGTQNDAATGKKWLVLDGGTFTASNVKYKQTNPLLSFLFRTITSFDGNNTMNARPRHYRVEMQDIDPETGEFTFGPLQTFSLKAGSWVPGGDESLRVVKKGRFMSVSESGYPADTFEGIRMKASEPRTDVIWYPGENWGKTPDLYSRLIETMGSAYRFGKSDYYQLFGN